ncbi:probable G-protein coupled receptor CG31760, partial [Amphibalanus amphitrite]
MRQDPALMEKGVWTHPYLRCMDRKWIISYTVRVPARPSEPKNRVNSFISFDVDVSRLDINQCDVTGGGADVTGGTRGGQSDQLEVFRGLHKCHDTSKCIFTPGRGWLRGGYICRCLPGFYAPGGQPEFDGISVEVAYEERLQEGRGGGSSYDMLYICKPCAPGCVTCTSDRPCMAAYNWVFRIVLLTISMLCVLMTFIVIGLIVRFKRLKVIKAGSPIFLTVTLLGCVAMYMEMAAIFPVLDTYSCVATKWTRHMGFCITYSALLLKTWRVSLTYRVKSAHKLKLTDKQLLQWLFPILLIM